MFQNLSSNHVNGSIHNQAFIQETLEKERLVKLLASERFKTMKALREVDDFALIYAEGGWRIKDILGHIAAWEREVLATLQAFHAGDSYSLGDDLSIEEYNQRNFEQRKKYSPAQIRMDWGMVRRDLQFVINQIAPERMNDLIDFPWGEKGTISQIIKEIVKHEATHLAEILTVLQSERNDKPQ